MNRFNIYIYNITYKYYYHHLSFWEGVETPQVMRRMWLYSTWV